MRQCSLGAKIPGEVVQISRMNVGIRTNIHLLIIGPIILVIMVDIVTIPLVPLVIMVIMVATMGGGIVRAIASMETGT
jgi:hypothetical protein